MTVTSTEKAVASIDGTEIESVWTLVTPELAADYLERNIKNRNIRKVHLDRLIADMDQDRYLVTHQGIAFDTDNVMIDGQHRCAAIVATRKPQWMLVTTGLPSETQVQVDGGARRLASDFFGQYGKIKVAALRMILTLEKYQDRMTMNRFHSSMGEFTTAQLHDEVPRFADRIDRILSISAQAARPLRGKVGQSALIAAAIRFPDIADEMLITIANNGIGLPSSHPTMSLLRYRGTGRVQIPPSAFMAHKAFHARHYNQQLGQMRVVSTQEIRLDRNTPGMRDTMPSFDFAAWRKEYLDGGQ